MRSTIPWTIALLVGIPLLSGCFGGSHSGSPQAVSSPSPTPSGVERNGTLTADFDFEPKNPVVGQRIQFADKSQDTARAIVERAWDFGDGHNATGLNPAHAFAQAGRFEVQLRVKNDGGTEATALRVVRVQSGPTGNNSTDGDAEPPLPPHEWPPLDSATIRPGVNTLANDASCTSNFVFLSPDNRRLYLGSAAHCVDGLALGDPVQIAEIPGAGALAYSSWIALNLTDCVDENGFIGNEECLNDFALLEIQPDYWEKVHPAVLHWGGPTELGDSTTLNQMDRVLVYGNSGLWPADPLSWHEGVVLESQGDGPQFSIYTVAPGVPGDSGSPVLAKGGAAEGVLTTLQFAPLPGVNGIVGLKRALELMTEKSGMEARLATWQVLDPGLLP